MTLVSRKTLTLVLTLLAQPALANGDYGTPGSAPKSTAPAVSSAVTASVVSDLEGGVRTCQSLPQVYRFDCYRQNYGGVVDSLSGKKGYRDAQRALRGVEKTLDKVMRRNLDRSVAPVKVGGATYRAIKPEAVDPAAKKFDQARAEAVTILLRSGGETAKHYQQIAGVVGSNKLLIRSEMSLTTAVV